MSQDWQSVVIRKPFNKNSEREEREKLLKVPNVDRDMKKKQNLNPNNERTLSKSLREEDGSVPQINYVTASMSQVIRQSRMDKNLTQEQLARMCNLEKSIISDIENPIKQVVYNASHINKISKALSVVVPRK
jgi:ribosome-binding protein aMBF1 (putative translation factor)